MKDYVVSGGAVKSDGTRYPFHRAIQAPNLAKAREETVAWLKGKGEKPAGPDPDSQEAKMNAMTVNVERERKRSLKK